MKAILKPLKISIFITSLALYFCGCSIINKNNQSIDTSYEYTQLIKKWTRSGRLYKEFDTLLVVDALYKSNIYRNSYIKLISESRLLNPSERERLLYKEQKESSKYTEFFIAVYTGNTELNNLDKKESEWTILLEGDDGKKIKAAKIMHIKHSNIPLKNLYPFITPWKRLYLVKFDKEDISALNDSYNLLITGILGKIGLSW